jgi:hypothetical protein
MSTLKQIAFVAACLCVASAAVSDEGPQLGEALSSDQLRALDYTVMPDGDGLPAGSGDASAGREVYNSNCLACHGENGHEGINDKLVGGHGSLTGDQPLKTVGSYWPYATTLFDYVRRAMPFQSPGSLSNNEIYAVTAYILYLNEIVAEDHLLDAKTLPAVQMPNRENFVWAYEPE